MENNDIENSSLFKAIGQQFVRDEIFTDVSVVSTAAIAYQYYSSWFPKQPCHTSIFPGRSWVNELLTGHPRRLFEACRVDKHVFTMLCEELTTKYGFGQRYNATLAVEESVAIFLQTLANNMSNRQLQERYQHSGETISRHFHIVLSAMKRLSFDYIKPNEGFQTMTHSHIGSNSRYLPFRDCIGALDGTHVGCIPPPDKQLAFCCRKGGFTQNILAVCDFDQRFTFISCGWEGSMHDNRVFKKVVSNPNEGFPYPVGEKYYLVDAGYPNKKGFLAPYKGDRMHTQQFRIGGRPRNLREHFNEVHSALRSVIERTFGVWKKKWAILRDIPPYDYSTQVDIVGCSMALHNFILEHERTDEDVLTTPSAPVGEPSTSVQTSTLGDTTEIYGDMEEVDIEDLQGDREMDAIRDRICRMVMRNRGTGR